MIPSWPIDPLLVAGMLTILLALAWRGARAEQGGGRLFRLALRVAVILGVGAVLIGPGRWVEADRALKPEVTLVLDTSRSMAAADATGRTRLDAVRQSWLSEKALASLREVARPTILTIDESVRAVAASDFPGLAALGSRSRLVLGLGEQLSSGRPGRIVLMSDGVDTDGRALTDLLNAGERTTTRFDVVSLAAQEPPRDARVEAEFNHSWARRGEAAELNVTIAGNMPAGTTARLIIRESTIDGPIVAERRVPVDGARRERFDIVPQVVVGPGALAMARYHASLESPSGDSEPMNNRSLALLQVVGVGRRTLLIEGEPDWESRFLVDALVSEAGADVTTVYAMGGRAPGRFTRLTTEPGSIMRRALADQPLDAASLAEFDLVVLGRGVSGLIGAEFLAAIREHVEERGLGLLFLRGPEVPTGLEWASAFESEEEPIEFERAIVAWDDEEVFDVSRLRVRRGVLRSNIAASARVEGTPLFVESSHGLGRVGTMLADGLWQTVLASDNGYAGARRFWNRVARRLTDGASAPDRAEGSVWLDRMIVTPGEQVRAVVRLREQPPQEAALRVIDPSGHEERITLSPRAGSSDGILEATIVPAADGEHRVVVDTDALDKDESIATGFLVRRKDTESVDGAVRDAELRRLAELSGGTVWRVDQHDAFIQSLRHEREAGEIERRFAPAWDEYWVFAMIAGLASAEWWLRRRGGMA